MAPHHIYYVPQRGSELLSRYCTVYTPGRSSISTGMSSETEGDAHLETEGDRQPQQGLRGRHWMKKQKHHLGLPSIVVVKAFILAQLPAR